LLLNLRQAIFKRVQDKSSDELVQVIEESIGGDDRVLPGLGVLFEKIWEQSDDTTQKKLAESLRTGLDGTEKV
jgi:small acid-soluble spore protein I (minor)